MRPFFATARRWAPTAAVALAAAASGLVWQPRAESRATGSVTGRVTLKERGLFGGASSKSNRSGVVIHLENVPGATATPPAPNPAVRQRDRTFLPRVTAVPVGSSVDFPNEDKIFHNVFSLSQTAKFDLGLYKSGSSKAVRFDRPGVVDVYCNIHPEMVASIKVVPSHHYAVTDAAGSFRIDDVPPGTYPVVGWEPRGAEYRGAVTIQPGGTAQVDFELTEGATSARHLRKDGTPYGRYE